MLRFALGNWSRAQAQVGALKWIMDEPPAKAGDRGDR